MKTLALFCSILVLAFTQIAISQVIDEPQPSPCEICKKPCTRVPGAAYGYGWSCTHTPDCKFSTTQNSEQQLPNIMQNMPTEMQQLNNLIDLFNTPNTDSKRLVEQEAARKRIAEMKAIEDKKQLDRIARNEKLKEELKPIEFVPFQTSPAPETMEDREIRILKNTKGVNYNTGDFSGGSGSVRIEESEETAEQSEAEKKFYEDMKKIESNKLGKLAAFIGRSIYGISKEVNSFMLDASRAITNNDPYTMQELADIEGKKFVVNGVIDGAKVTAKAYADKAVSTVKNSLISAAINQNIALLKSETTVYLEKYKKEYPLTYEWFKYQ